MPTHMTYDGNKISNPVSTNTTCDRNKILLKQSTSTEQNGISNHVSTNVSDEGSIPALTVGAHDADSGTNCDDDGDIVGNHVNVPKLLCCTCNVNNDSSADKTSDDVDTFDDNTVCVDVLPALFSSSDVDIDDGEDEVLHDKAFQAIDNEIDSIIAD